MRWLLVVTTLAGCMTYEQPVDPSDPGGGDPTPQTGSASGSGETRARQAFDQSVYPILSRKCGFCHDETSVVLPFVDSDPTSAYDFIKSQPGILGSPMYSQNATLLTSPDPTDPYTTDELMTLEQWFSFERSGQ